MENQEIAGVFKLMATLMELHDENPFKIRAIQSAVLNIEKSQRQLHGLTADEIGSIDGLGKSIAGKVVEIITTGTSAELTQLISQTPEGVIGLLDIKGIGPKKVKSIWKDLGIESKEALLIACNDNRIAALKGFGEKTQETIKQGLLFKQAHKEKFLYAEAEPFALQLEEIFSNSAHVLQASVAGELRRKMEVIDILQYVIATNDPIAMHAYLDSLPMLEKSMVQSGPFTWRGKDNILGCKIEIFICTEKKYASTLYIHSSAPNHLKIKIKEGKTLLQFALLSEAPTENLLLQDIGLQYIEPELREGFWEIEAAKENLLPELLNVTDLKGILHNHSTYSDGKHTLEEMAVRCKELGYEYLGICDHSKSGNFYNGGMYENKVREQHQEIDHLNIKLAPFKIFKGIESDILSDGSLDYDEHVLASFDFIVASIHSNLKMNEDKATERLLKAIENPYTTMLGHPSGRILLEREAYPVNYKKIIDACAVNNVAIEINADPHRLDLDWRHVKYALDKGVMISVNPDAHHMDGYENMKYGVYVGRKAGLTKAMTFNALSLGKVEEYFLMKKQVAH